MTEATTEDDDMPEDLGEDQAGPEPSLDGLMRSLLGGGEGWDSLDNKTLGALLNKQLQDNRQKLRKDALAFRECFSTPAGRKVLETLLDQTVRRTAWPVHAMQDAAMLQCHGIWREAENSFVMAIVEAIAHANNAELKPRSEP